MGYEQVGQEDQESLYDFTKPYYSKALEILSGRFDKRFLLRIWIPSFIIAFSLSLLYSFLNYPGDFSVKTNSISSLGDYIDNPRGWFGFTAALVALSVFLFSLSLYLHYRISRVGRKSSFVATLFLILASMDALVLSLVAESSHTILGISMVIVHVPLAIILFGLFIGGALIYLYPILVGMTKGFAGINIKKVIIIPYAIFFAIDSYVFISIMSGSITIFWEWVLVLSIIVLYLGICISISDHSYEFVEKS